MAEQDLNIYQRLAKIRKQVEVIKKNKSGCNYKYVSDDELLARISGLMDKYSLMLIPQDHARNNHGRTVSHQEDPDNKRRQALRGKRQRDSCQRRHGV